MRIEKIDFGLNSTNLDRISLLSDVVMRMEVRVPHIVTTLAMMTDSSPYQGSLSLYDIGFHAHWQTDGKNRIEMELTQHNME